MKLHKTETVQERFNRKIRITPGCWIWTASKKPFGYGIFMLNYKVYLAHRTAFELYCGPIPDGMHVLHRCDNPECANPAHLFIGTHQDNMKDKTIKGRARGCHSGEKNHNAKLTAEQVRLIRVDKRSYRVIAKAYGVTKNSIAQIIHGVTWSQI